MSENETLWHVQVEEGLVKVWSIDQLDAAFKAGLIDEATFVLEEGSTTWQTLGALLGGDEPEAPVVAAPRHEPAPQSYTPQSLAPQTYTPTSFAPQSTAPMVADIDDLDAPVAFRSKKRGVVITLSLVAVAAGVAIAGFRFGNGATAADPAPVAAAAPAPVAVAPPPPVADAPLVKPAEAAAAEAQRFNADQRKALLDADKAREAKLAEKHKERAAASPRHHKSSHEKTPFHNGGATGDPLNAKL